MNLRSQYPVLDGVAYFNAGTCGPMAAAAIDAAAAVVSEAARDGRALPYFERMFAERDALRAAYAARLNAAAEDVAITTCTSDAMTRVLRGLALQAGDEVLTAPDEHPGLLGPLARLRARGIRVRTAPLERIAEAVEPSTTVVACSHVSWITGALAPAALAEVGREIPVLLDGAQGAGAIAVDAPALGCAAYAAAGQKWLCGPVGLGMLWIAPAWRERLRVPDDTTYVNLVDANVWLDNEPWTDARVHDAPALAAETLAGGVAAHAVLDAFGWQQVHARAIALAGELASRLREAGRVVAPRGPTTLVSWEEDAPDETAARLHDAGVLLRSLPGTPYVRASVGAWNDAGDVDRLLAAL